MFILHVLCGICKDISWVLGNFFGEFFMCNFSMPPSAILIQFLFQQEIRHMHGSDSFIVAPCKLIRSEDIFRIIVRN